MRRSKRAAVAVALGLTWTAAATEIPWEPHLLASRPDGPTAAVAGDFDGDGDLDVMVASDGDDQVRWAVNTDGAGTFGFLQTVAAVANPVDLAVGDLDGDGDLDAVAASFGAPGALVWLENDGSPEVLSWPAHEIAERVTPIDVELADLDGDGDFDVAAASVLDDGIAWHESDGGSVPSFTDHSVTSTRTAWAAPRATPTARRRCWRSTSTATAISTWSPPRTTTTGSPGTRTPTVPAASACSRRSTRR